jgi:protein-disulfide isomerase
MANVPELRVVLAVASGQVVGTPTLFIDGVVHRGGYDPPTLLAALAP